MQASWFENAAGRWHEQKGDCGRALKMYTSVVKHYDTFQDDEYDFHTYCLRKTTLRSGRASGGGGGRNRPMAAWIEPALALLLPP